MKISLKAARVNAGLTQAEAAQLAGISESTLMRVEKGTSTLSGPELDALCKAYGCLKEDLRDAGYEDRQSNAETVTCTSLKQIQQMIPGIYPIADALTCLLARIQIGGGEYPETLTVSCTPTEIKYSGWDRTVLRRVSAARALDTDAYADGEEIAVLWRLLSCQAGGHEVSGTIARTADGAAVTVALDGTRYTLRYGGQAA